MLIVYAPALLRNLDEICRAFGVGEKQVKAWVEEGAPIAVEGEGVKTRYSAETTRLQLWREGRRRLPATPRATAGVDATGAR